MAAPCQSVTMTEQQPLTQAQNHDRRIATQLNHRFSAIPAIGRIPANVVRSGKAIGRKSCISANSDSVWFYEN